MNPATWWWLENTAAGRKVQRRILAGALLPRAKAEAAEEATQDAARASEAPRTPHRRC